MAIKYQQVSRQTQSPSDPYYEADRQRQVADALMQSANTPRNFGTASSGQANTMGLTQLAQALLSRYADKRATGTLNAADAQTTAQNSAAIKQLIPDQVNSPGFALQSAPGATVDSVTGTDPTAQSKQAALESIFSGSDPRAVHGMLAQALAERALPQPEPKPEPFTLGEGQVRYGADGRQIAAGPAKSPQYEPDRTLVNVVDKTQPNGYRTIKRSDFGAGMQEYQKPNASQTDGAPVKPDNGAVGMLLTGMPISQAIPGFGKQGVAERKAARDGAIVQLMKDNPGWSEMDAGTELAKRAIDFAGGKGAGVQTTKQLAANQSFLGTIEKNIANADALSKQVGGDTSPAMNKIFNMWKRGITGDPLVRKLDIYNNEIQGEAGKLASGGVGSVSATSDTQLAKQVQLLQTADNYAAWRAAADALHQSGDNRVSSILESARSNRDRVPGATAAPVAPPASAITKTLNGKTYTQRDGKWYAD